MNRTKIKKGLFYDMYSVKYWCANCDNHFEKEYKKGELANTYSKCPRCETNNAKTIR